jgi:hypothetical protein
MQGVASARLGNEQFDGISLPEPDLSIYDRLPPVMMTRDPGSPPPASRES